MPRLPDCSREHLAGWEDTHSQDLAHAGVLKQKDHLLAKMVFLFEGADP